MLHYTIQYTPIYCTGFTLGALRHVVDSHPLVEKVHDVIDGSQSEEALHQACESSLTQQSVGSADDTHLPQPGTVLYNMLAICSVNCRLPLQGLDY